MEEKKKKQKNNRCDKYSKLIKAINLESVQITSIDCNRNRNCRRDKAIDLNVSFGIDSISREGSEVGVVFIFELLGFFNPEGKETEPSEISPENILMRISLEILIIYTIDIEDEDLSLSQIECYDEILEEFADRNVPINVWPYVREIVSNLTVKMGLPPLTIPVYKKTPKF